MLLVTRCKGRANAKTAQICCFEPYHAQELLTAYARPAQILRGSALVPEGQSRIAQRFNAGCGIVWHKSRKGRPKNLLLGRPSGTCLLSTRYPALKRWAIVSHPSGMSR